MEKVQHEKYATWNKCNIKKCNMEEVQHGKNATWKKLNKKIVEAQQEPPQASKMEKIATILPAALCSKQSAAGRNCNMRRLQLEKNVKRKHWNV